MKQIYAYLIAGITCTSCSDFLDTEPYDSLSPSTTWQSEDDAQSFLVGCYDGWADANEILYLDCGSDIGYARFNIKSGFSRNTELKVVLNFSGGFEVFTHSGERLCDLRTLCDGRERVVST